jgi:hypothetical protein
VIARFDLPDNPYSNDGEWDMSRLDDLMEERDRRRTAHLMGRDGMEEDVGPEGVDAVALAIVCPRCTCVLYPTAYMGERCGYLRHEPDTACGCMRECTDGADRQKYAHDLEVLTKEAASRYDGSMTIHPPKAVGYVKGERMYMADRRAS